MRNDLSNLGTNIMVCFFLIGMVCDHGIYGASHLPDKIKGAYFYAQDACCGPKHLDVLAEYGLNCGIAKCYLSCNSPATDVRIGNLQRFNEVAQKAGILFVPVLDFCGGEEVQFLQGHLTERYVLEDGRRMENTPCPLDEKYWERVIYDRFAALATLGIKNLVLDPEMYGADTTGYSDPCMCPKCLADFRKESGVTIPGESTSEQGKWLMKNGLLKTYTGFQEERLAKITGKVRAKLLELAPDITLGFLLYQDKWFFRGLLKGLGTKEDPCLVFSEATYSTGYTNEVPVLFKDLLPNGILIPGLWLAEFRPKDLAIHAYHLAAHSGGYWLFTTRSLAMSTSELLQLPPGYRIPAPAKEYWTSIKQANEELRALAERPSYNSFLKLNESRGISAHLDIKRDLNLPYLEPLLKKNILPSSFKPSYLRSQHFVLLYLKKNQEAEISLSCKRLGNYRNFLGWKLLSNRGEIVKKGEVALEQTENVEFTAPIEGMYAVVADAGANAFTVRLKECPYVYWGQPWFHFWSEIAPELYFFVPKGTSDFVVTVKSEPPEAFACDILAPNGRSMGRTAGVFPAPKELKVSVPEGSDAQIWKLHLGRTSEGPLDDVYVSFSGNIPPYISENRDFLLIPTGR